jgi:Tol biopolymer transport system component
VTGGATTSKQIRNGPLTVINQSQGRGGVYTVGRAGLGKMVVPCQYSQTTCLELEWIAWSPDGAKIALGANSYGGESHYDGLHVIDLTTGNDRQLTGGPNQAGLMGYPAWSPDGKWLAYEALAPGRISLAKADGSRHSVLLTGTHGWVSSPTWSPDGNRIAFASGSDHCQAGVRPGCAIYVMRRNGTHLRLLARHAAAPAWSPLGATIAYQARCGIRLITPSGLNVTPHSVARCQHIGVPGQPVWSPDGHKIAINHGPGKTQGLYVMNADGTNLALITRTTGHGDSGIARAAWRPRSKSL